jgi:hypothetical protein
MKRWKKLSLLLSLCLIGLMGMATVFSSMGAINIELISGDTVALRVRNTSDVVLFQIDSDGSMNIYNSSGTRVWGIDNAGKPEESIKANYLVVDTQAEARGASETYNLLKVDTVNYVGSTSDLGGLSGVSLYLPPGNVALDGYILKIVNHSASGTTDVILVLADDVARGSGVTNAYFGQNNGSTGTTVTASGAVEVAKVYDVIDAVEESITLQYRSVSATSGYWDQIDRR